MREDCFAATKMRSTTSPAGMPTSVHDQGLYIRTLKTIPNLTVKYGHFLTHTVSMYLATVTPPKRVWVEKTEEKGSDVDRS